MKKLLSIALAAAILCISCSKVPSGIIQPEEMAQLLADIHTGEAVVDMNRRDYRTDSARQAFKQSVYARHGVDAATVDSSFMWYGRNISYYMDVYDRTIEILEHRLIESGNKVAAEAALSIAGDSVDVWPYARYVAIGDFSPSRTMTFNFSRDENWQRGDMYTWRAKLFNNPEKSTWQIVAEYSDGSIDFISQDLTGEGWKELTVYTDSLLDATRVYGYLTGVNRHGTALRFDSIAMVRKRLDPQQYSRRYSMRRLERILPEVEIKVDSTTTPADSTAR